MALISSYPPPRLPLTGIELLAGYSDGATRAVTVSSIIALAVASLTSADIIGTLGFTPYDAANPSGYVDAAGARGAVGAGSNITYDPETGLFSLSAGNVTGALGFAPYSAANPDGYVTVAGARNAVGAGSNITYNAATGVFSLTAGNVAGALNYTPANKAGETFGGQIGGPSLLLTGNAQIYDIIQSPTQSVPVSPLVNTGVTLTSNYMPVIGVALNANSREFGEVKSFYSAHGYGGTSGNDKVVSYRAMWADHGSSDAWVDNPLLQHSTDDFINTHVVEFDYNILTKNKYGTTIGGAGLVGGTDGTGASFATGSAWGSMMTGLSTQGGTITGGYGVVSAGTNPFFQRGYVAGWGCILSGFEEDSASVVAFRDCGTHTDGLNTEGATYSGSAVMIANGQKIRSRNGSGTITALIWMNGANLQIGDGASGTVSFGASIAPVSDNALTCGASGKRWSAIWAANGAIQTSGAAGKTDVAAIDPASASIFIDALTPKSYRWIIGGRVPIHGSEEQDVLTGYEDITTSSRLNGEDVEQTFRTPVYERRSVDIVTGYEDVPGKRTHFGFLAGDVKAAYEAAGIGDFGGYVKDDDGTEGIRPDQILAIAITEIRSLRQRVAALEAGRA